jgi:hypothetical protein
MHRDLGPPGGKGGPRFLLVKGASMTTSEEAKEYVLSRYPDARCFKDIFYNHTHDYTIYALVGDPPVRKALGSTAFTEENAWWYAAQKIKFLLGEES